MAANTSLPALDSEIGPPERRVPESFRSFGEGEGREFEPRLLILDGVYLNFTSV